MCGVAGFIDLDQRSSREQLEAEVGRMAAALVHRGPDDAGVWVDAGAGVALGHRRLAIVDRSARGRQPMVSASGRLVISFNGEIYNFEELRVELARAGHTFASAGDTEVVLAAFAEWGVGAALRRFNGMFALALWDRAERRLVLARDRLGEKPMYVGFAGRRLLFGSELKALRAHPAFVGELDRGALALYLHQGYVPAPYTIHAGLSKVRPACTLSMRLGPRVPALEEAPYWSPRESTEPPLRGDARELTGELDALLQDAVRVRMRADVGVGAFLSGGIDSSTVVALMRAHGRVRTFAIGYHERSHDESGHARAVASHLGTEHTELHMTAAMAGALIPALPALFDEPFADASQVPTLLLSQLARRQVTVALAGDGGDELFCGYDRYVAGHRRWRALRPLPGAARRSLARGLRGISRERWDEVARLLPCRLRPRRAGARAHRLAALLHASAPEVAYRPLVSTFDEPGLVLHDGVEPPTAFTTPAEWAPRGDPVSRMMYLDLVTYLPDDILVKLDRASMHASLEARLPFLDHRVVALARRLPLDLKLRGARGKWLLRQVLRRYVPARLTERPKMGFGMPLAEWLRGPLRPWAEDLLSVERLQRDGLLRVAPIRRLWAEHLSGANDWATHLWTVLMLQAWLDR